jgi:hypothetical protein
MAHVDTATTAGPSAQAGRVTRLRIASLGLVSMLIIEFVLGIIYDLYGTAPTAKKSIGLFSSPDLALHVILGILLFIAAVALLVRAVGARHRLAIWLSAVGLLSIVGAGFAGLGFTGSGASSASLGMSLAFALALACYVSLASGLPLAAPPASRRAAQPPEQSSGPDMSSTT